MTFGVGRGLEHEYGIAIRIVGDSRNGQHHDLACPGDDHGHRRHLSDLERIAQLVRDRGITTVFVEPLASPEEAETIARETGAEVAVLDPLEGLTEEQLAAGEDYFSVMLANLEALRAALDCE